MLVYPRTPHLYKKAREPGVVVVHACNPRTQEAETEGSLQTQGKPGLHSKFQAGQCPAVGGDGVVKIAQEAFASMF